MIGKSTLRIGRLLGIELRLHYSWFAVFVLVVWSLAGQHFPMMNPGWAPLTYWWVGILTSVLFFASLVVHELAHSVVAQAFGVPVRHITLFIFGGVASLGREPQQAREELLIALAGPGASLAIGASFGVLAWLGRDLGGAFNAATGWLAWINVALALFNLIPGFPLDGGRVLRALAWSFTGNLQRATRIAAHAGRLVGLALIVWGGWQVLAGGWIAGVWIAFIGWFLHSAATQSEEAAALHEALAGHAVREVVRVDHPRVSRDLTLDAVIERVVLPSGLRYFPVVEGDRLEGLLTLQRIKEVPRERWRSTRAVQIVTDPATLETVQPDEDLFRVLERMTAEGTDHFPVIEDGQFLGMITRDALVSVARIRSELQLWDGAFPGSIEPAEEPR